MELTNIECIRGRESFALFGTENLGAILVWCEETAAGTENIIYLEQLGNLKRIKMNL